jgi:hypothetical protein
MDTWNYVKTESGKPYVHFVNHGVVGKDYYIAIDDGSLTIAKVVVWGPDDRDIHTAEQNANIIVAAPAMLEALEQTQAYLAQTGDCFVGKRKEIYEKNQEALRMARPDYYKVPA